MTTVRQICTRALRRLGITDAIESPTAEDAASAVAHLNELVYGWASYGVDVLQQSDFTLDSEFVFWVPPLEIDAATIAALSYRGTWDANANTPALASGTGTEGYVYKVATAGSTALDDVASWAVNDFGVFDGRDWRKGISSKRFESGVTAMLVVKLATEFGAQVPAEIAAQASSTWSTMLPYYVKPPYASFDLALTDIPSRASVLRHDDWLN